MVATDALVLVASSLTALAAALGALPLLSGVRPPPRLLGLANALASGLMLGVAYALMSSGLERGAVASGLGALVGIGGVVAAHAATKRPDAIRLGAIHAVPEGVAIGVAMAVGLPFGAAMALALAVHNVPEATVAIAGLTERGRSLSRATLLAVAVNAGQVVFAIAAFAVVAVAPAALAWGLGAAVGALVYLVMAELLPDSYRGAGRTSIALVAIVAVGMVVLLHDRAR